MKRILAIFDALLENAIALIYGVMIIVMVIQVILRYGFDSPFMWAEEFSRFLFVWIVFIGAPVAILRKAHLEVDYFTGYLPGAVNRTLKVIFNILAGAFLLMLTVTGFQITRAFIGKSAFTMDWLPLSLFYLPVGLGAFFMLINLVRVVIEEFTDLRTGRAEQ